MKFGKWMFAFLVSVLIAALLLCGFNYAVDPFGVFGDKVLKWSSYDMVNNPRVSKIAYLDENHGKYDSYIIGGSKSSSISPELLNKYYGGAKFYSMLMYGGDFHDYEKTLYYIVDNYKPKNIVVHMSMQEIGHFNEKATDFKQTLHAKVTGDPLIPFYFKYLTLNPTYSYTKLEGLAKRSIDPFEYSQFIPESGVYNKVKRDAEKTDDLEQYKIDNPEFSQYLGQVKATASDKIIASLEKMKAYCDSRNISFRLITGATYQTELAMYNMDELKKLWVKLANVTDFWDFSGYTMASQDPRYFYDPMHYRNNLGAMMLGYIFKDPEVYVPANFGHYTTKDNAAQYAEQIFTRPPQPSKTKAKVPILVYHNFDPNSKATDPLVVTPDKFKSDMLALKEQGYETVFLGDLVDYVNGVKELPEKPVVITMDDGYLDNYEYAYPILKELGMKATISVIGWSLGRTTHREPGKEFDPHFTWEQAKEMVDSGVIDIQNHSYDMHGVSETDIPYRVGILQKKGESSGTYARLVQEDALQMQQMIESHLGNKVVVYTYPFGKYSLLGEQALLDAGYKVTLTVKSGTNQIIKGDPRSLIDLKRINAESGIPSATIMQMVNK
jgi:peptidoglycan/xylan/chitin deacetylase (PgdA/CDA1 family)